MRNDLERSQGLLARLYTDAALRERFFSAPQEVAAEWGLDEDEARQLIGLAPAQVRRFAASLQSKRLHQARQLLPALCRASGPRFAELFREYSAAAPLPGGAHRYLADALAFAAYLSARPDTPLHWGELALYEALHHQAAGAGRFWRARRFRYPVHQLAGEETAGGLRLDGVLRPRPMIAFWWRPGARGRLRHWMWRLPGGK